MKQIKNRKVILAALAVMIVFTLGVFQSCSNEMDAAQGIEKQENLSLLSISDERDEIVNSIEFEEYLAAGLDLRKAYDDLASSIKNIDFSKLETGIASNGMKYKKMKLQNEINRLTIKLNQKKGVLLNKFPDLKKKSIKERREFVNTVINKSAILKSIYPKLKKVKPSTTRFKAPIIEMVYGTCDNIIGFLSDYMCNNNQEVMTYVLEDGTTVSFLCNENTLDICYGYAPSAGGYFNGKKIMSVIHAHDTETGESYPSEIENNTMNQFYNQFNIPLGIVYGDTIYYY